MVTGFDQIHVRTNLLNDARAFMPKHDRQSRAEDSVYDRLVAVTHAIGRNLDPHFSRLWRIKINIFDFEWSFQFVQYCGFHNVLLFSRFLAFSLR